ncbi:hypothetical protein NMG60_11015023 [Bertholletia excelsa]
MPEPRRLRGHKATATCCISSRDRPGLIASSGEDGCICWFDMRCKDVVFILDVGNDPISSLCFKPGNEDVIHVSMGSEVKMFDVKLAASWKCLQIYNYNKEEINQIACNSRSSFLAAGDDGGDVKIIDINQHCLYKTLRAGHLSICSSVQFLPWRAWEAITGGFDSKLVMWDFSKGRPYKILDFGAPDPNCGVSTGQSLNPAFVHAIAVPEVDIADRLGKVCALARGDGVVDIIDIESERETVRSKTRSKPQKRSQARAGGNTLCADSEAQDLNGRKKMQLDYSLGGHTAAASCVAFSMFGEKGKLIVSGGNDKMVKIWDWSRYFNADQTNSNGDLMHLNINLNRK